MGHRLGSSLGQMGILSTISRKIIAGEMTAHDFSKLLRKRHGFTRYQRELANLAINRDHPELAKQVCNFVLRDQDNVYFRKMLARL